MADSFAVQDRSFVIMAPEAEGGSKIPQEIHSVLNTQRGEGDRDGLFQGDKITLFLLAT